MYFACIINYYSNTCVCGHEKNGIKLAIFLTNMHGTSNWFWMDNQALFGTFTYALVHLGLSNGEFLCK